MKEAVRAVSSSEPIDAYQGLFLTELVDLLSPASPDEPLEDTLEAFISSASPLLDDGEALKKWLCSSDERGNHLWQVKGTGGSRGNGLTATLAEAQALEVRSLPNGFWGPSRPIRGSFRSGYRSSSKGWPTAPGQVTNSCGKPAVWSSIWTTMTSADLCEPTRGPDSFAPPDTLAEGIRYEPYEHPIEARLERGLARAALTVHLFEPSPSS